MNIMNSRSEALTTPGVLVFTKYRDIMKIDLKLILIEKKALAKFQGSRCH